MTLGVHLVGERDIVVTSPESGLTYRKDGLAPLLFAIDGIGRSSDPSEVIFWAWKAAHQKARAMGWLNS